MPQCARHGCLQQVASFQQVGWRFLERADGACKSACATIFALVFAVVLISCSGTPARRTFTYMNGDKASVDRLTFSVVENQVYTRLGTDQNARLPQNRFYVVDLSVFNSGSSDAAIPAMTLVDDSGKTYDELTDGSGVPRWLGVIRHVGANQTETGAVVFDAPASHYKLKLTDDTDPQDVFIDLPLSFVNEQMKKQVSEGTSDGEQAPAIGGAPPPAVQKKK
jgi:hypothetical protein